MDIKQMKLEYFDTLSTVNRFRHRQIFQQIETAPFVKIPKHLRDLLSSKELKNLKKIIQEKIDEHVDKDILNLEKEFKMVELKQKAKKNYVQVDCIKENKSRKRTWAKEIANTKKWGYNTFVVGVKNDRKHILNSQVDILLTIQKYI